MAKKKKSRRHRDPTVISQRATQLVAKFPKTSTMQLARKLHEEFGDWISLDACRSKIRYRRGAVGDRNRENVNATRKKHFRKRQNPADAEHIRMPPSLAEPWKPFKVDAKRIGVISDLHIPYHDEQALGAAVKRLKRMKPDAILINGDYGDWYTVSRWQKDPRKRRLKKEIEMQREGLRWLRGEFGKDCRFIFKSGNHEDRWEVYIWNNAAEMFDLDEIQLDALLEFDDLGIEWVKDERPVMCGKLPVFHGHELPRGLTNPVNMARGAFLRTVHTVLVAHGHRTSGHAESALFGEEIFCWSQGCLCHMHPKYARINKWNHGFAYVEVAKNKSFDVTNFRISRKGEVRSS